VVAPGVDGNAAPGSDRYEERYLYDLLADPWELENLAGLESHREVTEVLRARLLQRMAEAGEAPPQIVPAPSRGSGGQMRVSAEEARA
jgi:hypothetical protein